MRGILRRVEKNGPSIFAKIKERVREGRWVIVGGGWIQPDPKEKELPASVFWWESPDGSRGLAYRIPIMYGNYGMKLPEIIKTVFAMNERESVDMMLFYGVGNHGGGPTIKDVNNILQWPDETEREQLSFSSPNTYFSSVLKDAEQFPVVRKDLQHHSSGCYSASRNMPNDETKEAVQAVQKLKQERSKKMYNRFSELMVEEVT